ncbi:MAG TPA: YggS family pyridoxal phosphate-dependent enzyme [Ktedonobacterales bacterium]|nr:YggS family pyridoxal phosphate-dependent enzyme [Ktedonobacterales bacterium]
MEGLADDPTLAASLADVRRRMQAAATRAGHDLAAVRLIAVTKTVPAERLIAAAALGLTTFGENRVQEAREKRERLALRAAEDGEIARLLAGARWELIGHLQTNKAARALDLFERVQSVDSQHLAEALSARAVALGRVLPILLEVNVGEEASKSGFAPDASLLRAAAREIVALPGLRPQGLMCVAPIAERAEDARPYFRRLRALRDDLRAEVPLGGADDWRELSMGMSDDYEVAIEEGATCVRLGRALFGARPPLAR